MYLTTSANLESMHNTYIVPAGSSSAEQKESGEGHREKRSELDIAAGTRADRSLQSGYMFK